MNELVETSLDGHVALCRLNRPDARNALSPELMGELAEAVEGFDSDPRARCVVIAGSDEVFAAGADIRSLRERTFEESLRHPAASFWRRLAACKTPLVAAVSGFALGGGCELALLCDLIVASETAQFGQPEITLGIIPGGGGTQRLARVLGKQRAMEMVLTGRRIDAREAERFGLVNEVAPDGAAREAGGHRGRRDRPLRRPGARAPPLRAGDGDRGSDRGDGRLPGEAQPGLQGALVPRPNVFGPVFDEEVIRYANYEFRARRSRLGYQAGCERLGLSLWGVEPGSQGIFHYHFANEELLAVLSGKPTLRTPAGSRELSEGEVAAFPRGPHGAHAIANHGEETARMLFYSEMSRNH